MNISCVFDAVGVCVSCGRQTSCVSCLRQCEVPQGDGVIIEPPHSPTHGPGTELKKLLAMIGITSAPDCACRAHAAEMDRREQEAPGWCAANLDTIVGWLREQATARGLPFIDMAGKILVKRAIRNAASLTLPAQ